MPGTGSRGCINHISHISHNICAKEGRRDRAEGLATRGWGGHRDPPLRQSRAVGVTKNGLHNTQTWDVPRYTNLGYTQKGT